MRDRVVIIGSGIGGLTAGIILAGLNFQVTVVESALRAGGLMRGYRRGGIDCPTGIHYLGALDRGEPLRRLWDYLGVSDAIPLERMGSGGIIDRYIFDDFEYDLPGSIEAFEESLRRTFPLEQDRITTIMADLRESARILRALDMVLSPAAEAAFSPLSMAPMGQRLEESGCSRRLCAILSVPATLIGVPLQRCPAFFYYMTLASYLMSAWRPAVGAETADAFLSRFKSLGGEVLCGDGVAAVQVASGRTTGVALQSGRILPAAAVVAAIHPKTLLALLPQDSVRSTYAQRVSRMIDTEGLFGVNLAVEAAAHPALPYNVYRLHPEADGSLYRGIFCQVRPTSRPGVKLLSMITPSGIENWRTWEGTKSGERGGDYEAAKKKKAEAVIAEAENIFGPLRNAKLLDAYTPLTLRDRTGSPGGSPYGIMRSTDQLMKAASLTRSPIKGLYPAGQNRLSPGVMGTILGSFQAVRQMIGPDRFAREVGGGFR